MFKGSRETMEQYLKRPLEQQQLKWPNLEGSVKPVHKVLPNGTECVSWKLTDCELWWVPWPETLVKPQVPVDGGYYRSLKLYGNTVKMPRQTWCYGYAYEFSGQTHPVEPETPPEVQALYTWADAACGHTEPQFNMTLLNVYHNGRMCIGKHRDDERQFGFVHDVICFVTGPACRTLIIRDNKGSVVLKGDLPEGVYCMSGRKFQTNYTHEIPQSNPELFKKLYRQFAEEGENQLTASRRLSQPEFAKNVENKDREQWEEWCKWRASWTLRNFK